MRSASRTDQRDQGAGCQERQSIGDHNPRQASALQQESAERRADEDGEEIAAREGGIGSREIAFPNDMGNGGAAERSGEVRYRRPEEGGEIDDPQGRGGVNRDEGQKDEPAKPVTGDQDRLASPPIGVDTAERRKRRICPRRVSCV